MSDIVQRLKEICQLSDEDILVPTEQNPLPRYFSEWRDRFEGQVCPVLRPINTETVSKIARFCFENDIEIIPQGGNTGLVGGQMPLSNRKRPQILLSTERMNQIHNLDTDNNTVTVGAGVILENLHQQVSKHNRLFPLDLASRGSAQIGGLISTNAGGISVVRYGQMRSMVMGLQVVLPNGEVLDMLRTLRKNNMGYDLKQLFIGAEGTLGIITQASLKVFPVLKTVTCVLATDNLHQMLKILRHLESGLGDSLTGFEIIPETGLSMVLKHTGARCPFDIIPKWMVVVELSFPPVLKDDIAHDIVLETLEPLMENGTITDAVMAQNQTQAHEFWSLREALSEAQKYEGGSFKHDISVPISQLPDFVETVNDQVSKIIHGIRPVPFGHFADGNLHYNFSQPVDMTKADYLNYRKQVEDFVHEKVIQWNGSIAAEHGIGQAKADDQKRYKTASEYNAMKAVKQAFDPKNVMNPDKVLK